MVRPVYQYLVTKDFDPDQISIITAKTIEYAFNYHTGRGKKPRCTDFRVTTPKDYDEEEYILTHFRDKHDHKSRKRTNKQRAEENKLTDEHNDQSLLDEGLFTKR